MKGSESVYYLAIIFTFILGVAMIFVSYNTSLTEARNKESLDKIKSFLDMPETQFNKILDAAQFRNSLSYLRAAEVDNATQIFIKNTGELPLSGFSVVLDYGTVKPLIAPDILLPGSVGILAFDKSLSKNFQSSRLIRIVTKQGAEVVISR